MPQLKKILLVVYDEELRKALTEQLLLSEDFKVSEGTDGAQAIEKVNQQSFDLIILDVGLPATDGHELFRLIREHGVKSPMLVLTESDTDASKVLGINAGTNDYITKPFKFPVLLARIRAQLRQYEQSEDAILKLGPYMFNPAGKLLMTEAGNQIRLTEKETNILKFLYHTRERVIQRDTLLHEVWGYNAGVTTHTLETHIYRLRQKIETDPSNSSLLVTENGGYHLAT
jgi:DNA-binding response OmpR family regulator